MPHPIEITRESILLSSEGDGSASNMGTGLRLSLEVDTAGYRLTCNNSRTQNDRNEADLLPASGPMEYYPLVHLNSTIGSKIRKSRPSK